MLDLVDRDRTHFMNEPCNEKTSLQGFPLDWASSAKKTTVLTLSFQTDRYGQTVQTQIRLFLEQSIRVFTVCYSFCSFMTKYPEVWPHFFNFSKITAKFFESEKLGTLI